MVLVLSLGAKSLRWRSLLPRSAELSVADAYRIFHVAILLNNLLPFRLGDGARIVSGRIRPAATMQQAVVALVAERVMDGLLLLAVALVAIPMFAASPRTPNPFALPGGGWTLAVVAAALAAGAFAGWWWHRRSHGFGGGAARRWHAVVEDVRLVLSMGWTQVSHLAGWSVFVWAGTFTLHYLLLGAIGIDGSLLLAVVITLATNFSMLLPAAPANVGIFHAAAVAPLLAAGVGADLAVAYSLLAHAVNTVPPGLIGAASLLGHRRGDFTGRA